MLNKKLIILITIIALAASAVVLAYVNRNAKELVVENNNQEVKKQNQENQKEKETATTAEDISTSTEEIDTSGWTSYRNEEYGFEVKYPNNWFLENSTSFSFLVKDSDNTYFWLSMPPLGFGYDKNKAQISKINIDNIEAEKLEFIDSIVINFKHDDQKGLIRFKYNPKKREQYIRLFNQIMGSLKFF